MGLSEKTVVLSSVGAEDPGDWINRSMVTPCTASPGQVLAIGVATWVAAQAWKMLSSFDACGSGQKKPAGAGETTETGTCWPGLFGAVEVCRRM